MRGQRLAASVAANTRRRNKAHACQHDEGMITSGSTANLRTKAQGFRGFDLIRILISRGGTLMFIGNFPESLSQRILAGIILVGRLSVAAARAPRSWSSSPAPGTRCCGCSRSSRTQGARQVFLRRTPAPHAACCRDPTDCNIRPILMRDPETLALTFIPTATPSWFECEVHIACTQ